MEGGGQSITYGEDSCYSTCYVKLGLSRRDGSYPHGRCFALTTEIARGEGRGESGLPFWGQVVLSPNSNFKGWGGGGGGGPGPIYPMWTWWG